jgi:hypothetical protein
MARTKTASNAILYYESGQTYVPMAALTNSGDNITFESANGTWSGYEGKEPVVRPDGLLTGGVISAAASGTDNLVDTTALTCYQAGLLVSVAASTDNAATRARAYLLLNFAAGGYTNAVTSDLSKTVVGTTTTHSGELVAYNNTTRQWLVIPTGAGDVFNNGSEAITITAGTGAGTLSAVGAAPTHRISAITVNSSGAIAVVSGFEGASFSTTRGAIGGPPFIPVGSFSLGEVRFTTASDDEVDADEIFQVSGTHLEQSDFPVWDEDWAEGEITFASALPAIHTGGVPKAVYAAYYTPVFAEVPNSSDFVPAETTHSVTSTEIYGGTIGARSSSLGQGSFTCRLLTGVTDNLIKLGKNKNLWFKFLPDRYRDEYILTQGYLGISRTFPAGDAIQASCTISADQTSTEKES